MHTFNPGNPDISTRFYIPLLVFLFGCFTVLPGQGKAGTPILNTAQYVAFERDSVELTRRMVREWIVTRIATNRLQSRMRANSGDYENVIQAFYEEREELLEERGWTVEEFETVERRIAAAKTAMEMAEEMKANSREHQREIAAIRENENLTEQQKENMIRSMKELREQKRTRYIERTKPDWPSVRPYLSALDELTAWIAGNRPNPPQL